MTMTLIETKTLGTAAASIEFTSIPQDGTDLVIATSLRHTGNGFDNVASAVIRFNGSSTNFNFRSLFGTGNGGVASGNAAAGFIGFEPTATATSNTFGNTQIYVPNYTGSTNKSFSVDNVAENNGLTYMSILALLWSNTSAITSLSINSDATSFAIGSSVSLYKITKGSSGGVVVS
jgi:hypothetical protein